MFENIYGHDKKKEILKNIINSNKYANAYLFAGPPKVGKFSLSMEFATYILGRQYDTEIRNFVFPDFVVVYPILKKLLKGKNYIEPLKEILNKRIKNKEELFEDIENGNISIDAIREIIVFANKKPYISQHKVIIIKNAEMMKKEGANSFLKLLEEPPDNTVIILTTDNINSILPTIISRCQLIKFGYLSDDDIKRYFYDNYNMELTEEQIRYLDGTLKEQKAIMENIDFIGENELINIIKNKDYSKLLNHIKANSILNKRYFVGYIIKLLIKILNSKIKAGSIDKQKAFKTLDMLYEIEGDIKKNILPDEIIYYILMNINME